MTISCRHGYELVISHGESGMTARLVPFTVNGLILAASLVLLADRRNGRRSGWLPWTALAIGTTASLAANIATADTGTVSQAACRQTAPTGAT